LKITRTVLYPVALLLCLLSLLAGACSGNGAEPADGEVIIRDAPIHEVNVNIAESYPPQIFVYIKGGLSDGCTTFHELTTERSGTTIDIRVTTRRPKDAVCTEVYSYFEKNVALGSDFTSGETYTVNVNDFTTSFVMQ
jgi:inhibitor of cysteine peptidase